MSKFLKGIKGAEKKEPTPQEIDDIAEKLHARLDAKIESTPEAPKPFISVESSAAVSTPVEQIIVVEPVKPVKAKKPKPVVHRLTIDIPKDLFQQMEKDTKRRGQTMKGFIVSMMYDFYENKE
jgi:hypothetical protein